MNRDSENYRLLIENLPDAYAYHQIITDDDGTPVDYIILEVNAAFEEMTGLKREKIIGEKVTAVLPGIKKSEFDWIGIYGKVAQGGEAIRFESFSEPLGRWYDVRAYSDKPGCFTTVFRDITERKQAEEALRESEEKYRHIFKHSPIGIYYTDTNGVITDCNEVFVKSMGSTYDAIVGLDILSLPDQRIVQVINAALKGQLTTFEGIYESTTAEKITPLRALYAPIKNSDGLVMGVVAIVEDITERKKAEDEIRSLNEKLEERVKKRTAQLEAANRELDAFTYSASHDLRGPLNRISGFSEALLEDYANQLDPQGKDYLQRISNSSQHMGELIDDLLKLSRVTQHKISHEPVEMSVLVNLYLKELQSSDPARQVETVITPGLVAEADTALIRIALENLLGNAWKYSADEDLSRIEFGITTQEEKEVFYIRDNGTGFDMKHYEKLFTAFQRLHDAKAYPGTGIGLSIVSRIIQRHGGEIWAEGEPGKGATFFFTLP